MRRIGMFTVKAQRDGPVEVCSSNAKCPAFFFPLLWLDKLVKLGNRPTEASRKPNSTLRYSTVLSVQYKIIENSAVYTIQYGAIVGSRTTKA